jgi:hypothetical protein
MYLIELNFSIRLLATDLSLLQRSAVQRQRPLGLLDLLLGASDAVNFLARLQSCRALVPLAGRLFPICRQGAGDTCYWLSRSVTPGTPQSNLKLAGQAFSQGRRQHKHSHPPTASIFRFFGCGALTSCSLSGWKQCSE